MSPGDKCRIFAPPRERLPVANNGQIVTLVGTLPFGMLWTLPDGVKFRINKLPAGRRWWEVEEDLYYCVDGNLYSLPIVSSLYLRPLDHQPARQWFTDYFKKAIKV